MLKWLSLLVLALPILSLTDTQVSGYLQVRYSENYRNVRSFSLRRTKLWFKGDAPLPHWQFKLQGIFRWQNKGSLVLQDAYAQYNYSPFYLKIGQMVPDFSLERNQSDYRLPIIERARIIDALIPSAETLARDIGLQAVLQPKDKRYHIGLGIFNGNGANHSLNNDRNFLFTLRGNTTFVLPGQWKITPGISFAYRQCTHLALKKIFNHSELFTGTDKRWGAEFSISNDKWLFQGEFLQAFLDGNSAQGFYFLLNRTFNKKHQATFSVERFVDLSEKTSDQMIYIFDYGYLLNTVKNKILLDIRAQPDGHRLNFSNAIQLQLFFN